jgi:hypothetical protein
MVCWLPGSSDGPRGGRRSQATKAGTVLWARKGATGSSPREQGASRTWDLEAGRNLAGIIVALPFVSGAYLYLRSVPNVSPELVTMHCDLYHHLGTVCQSVSCPLPLRRPCRWELPYSVFADKAKACTAEAADGASRLRGNRVTMTEDILRSMV